MQVGVSTPRWSPTGPVHATPPVQTHPAADRYPPADRGYPPADRWCPRCGRTQPPLPAGARGCVFCAAPLPVQRWRAEVPIGAGPRLRPAAPSGGSFGMPGAGMPGRVTDAYPGPPSYFDRPPRWGFPPVVWRAVAVGEPHAADVPTRVLRAARYLCALAAVLAAVAAGAEGWRFALLLRGRTEVLSGPLVAASDRLVTVAALSAAGVALAAAAASATALVRLHHLAAGRAGLEPGRRPAAVLARLVVPGWNILGLGVVAGEIDGLLTQPLAGRPRMSRLVAAWWCSWVIDAVLVLLTLVRAFGRSEQSLADTVELHILVDLCGAAVGLLAALVFRRFGRLLRDGDTDRSPRWVVRPPEPTRRDHRPAPVQTAPVVAGAPQHHAEVVRSHWWGGRRLR